MPDQDKNAETPKPVDNGSEDAAVAESGAGYGNNAGAQGEDGHDEG